MPYGYTPTWYAWILNVQVLLYKILKLLDVISGNFDVHSSGNMALHIIHIRAL